MVGHPIVDCVCIKPAQHRETGRRTSIAGIEHVKQINCSYRNKEAECVGGAPNSGLRVRETSPAQRDRKENINRLRYAGT